MYVSVLSQYLPDTKPFALYHGRWQLSAIVLAAPLAYFSNYMPAWVALFVVHVIGACVFYPVDNIILNSDE